jgi:hypothetical protein
MNSEHAPRYVFDIQKRFQALVSVLVNSHIQSTKEKEMPDP